MAFTVALRRVLCLACLCALVCVSSARAADRTVRADFDGDGRIDWVAIDRIDPSALHVWLSTTGAADVIHGVGSFASVTAADIDGDHQPELIAREDSARGLRIWKQGTRHGFHTFPLRHRSSRATSSPSGDGVDDDPVDAPDALPWSSHLHDAALARDSLPAPPVARLFRASRSIHASASDPRLDPSAPRAPPTSHS